MSDKVQKPCINENQTFIKNSANGQWDAAAILVSLQKWNGTIYYFDKCKFHYHICASFLRLCILRERTSSWSLTFSVYQNIQTFLGMLHEGFPDGSAAAWGPWKNCTEEILETRLKVRPSKGSFMRFNFCKSCCTEWRLCVGVQARAPSPSLSLSIAEIPVPITAALLTAVETVVTAQANPYQTEAMPQRFHLLRSQNVLQLEQAGEPADQPEKADNLVTLALKEMPYLAVQLPPSPPPFWLAHPEYGHFIPSCS